MTGAVKNGQTKRDILKPVKDLDKELSHAKHSPEKMNTIREALFKEILPKFGTPAENLKFQLTFGGDPIDLLLEALTPDQKEGFRVRAKRQKNADYFQIPAPFVISFSEGKLAKIVDAHTEVSAQVDAYIANIIKFTGLAAQKEPKVKNDAQRPHGEAVRIVATDYPTTYNVASRMIESLTAFSMSVQASKIEAIGLLKEAQSKTLAKIDDVISLSKELSIEKNNYDHHDAWTKARASSYPYVEKCTVTVEVSPYSLDNFSKLLNEASEAIRDAQALMLYRGQKCMNQLTGRRHTMQQSVAQDKAFKDDHPKAIESYQEIQTHLQHILNTLTAYNAAIKTLEDKLSDRLEGISTDCHKHIQSLVTQCQDYANKTTALVPYALLANGQKREVRILKTAGNQAIDLVV